MKKKKKKRTVKGLETFIMLKTSSGHKVDVEGPHLNNAQGFIEIIMPRTPDICAVETTHATCPAIALKLPVCNTS